MQVSRQRMAKVNKLLLEPAVGWGCGPEVVVCAIFVLIRIVSV